MQMAQTAQAIGRQDARASAGMQRIGGAAGIGGGLAIMVSAAVLVSLTVAFGLRQPFEGKEEQFYAFLRADLPYLLLALPLQALGIAAILTLVRALDDRLRAVAPTGSPTAALYGYAAVTVFILAGTPLLGVTQMVAAGAPKATVVSATVVAFAVNGAAGVGGSVFSAAWLAAVNWIAARRGGLPRPLAYYGLVVAVVNLAIVLLGIHGPGPLLTSIWFVGAGAALWLRPQPAS